MSAPQAMKMERELMNGKKQEAAFFYKQVLLCRTAG